MLIIQDGKLPIMTTKNKTENPSEFVNKFINACRKQNGWKYVKETPTYKLAENYAKWCDAKRDLSELVYIFLIGHKMPLNKE